MQKTRDRIVAGTTESKEFGYTSYARRKEETPVTEDSRRRRMMLRRRRDVDYGMVERRGGSGRLGDGESAFPVPDVVERAGVALELSPDLVGEERGILAGRSGC